jgi:hypothetical protein
MMLEVRSTNPIIGNVLASAAKTMGLDSAAKAMGMPKCNKDNEYNGDFAKELLKDVQLIYI